MGRYEELFNAMKAGEQPAKIPAPKTPAAQERAPSKESQQAAKDEAMRLREEKAPTTKTEMGKVFKKGGKVCCSASKRADGIAQRGKTKGRIV